MAQVVDLAGNLQIQIILDSYDIMKAPIDMFET